MVTTCRQRCRAEAAGSSPILAEDIEDLQFYERKVKETLCLMKCNQDYREIAGEGALKRLPRATEKKFVDLAVYEYLHICYFQVGKLEKLRSSRSKEDFLASSDASNDASSMRFLVDVDGLVPITDVVRKYRAPPNPNLADYAIPT